MGSAEQAGATELPASGVYFTPAGQRATVCLVVHYTSYDTEAELKACRAAVVTVEEDDEGQVGLCVLHPTGPEFLTAVAGHHIVEDDPEWPRYTEGASGRQSGTWHWPELV